jgi:hypothetical protein
LHFKGKITDKKYQKFYNRKLELVIKDIDVNEHERLSSFMPRQKLKYRNSRVSNNDHNSITMTTGTTNQTSNNCMTQEF